MSQSFWESESVEETQPEQQAQPEQQELLEQQPEEVAAEPASLALSADDFSALEERILRAVNLVKSERQARAAAEERAILAEVQLSEQAPLVDRLQKELDAQRAERDQVRQRVEKLLAQLDALEL
jgi:uncharacterized coiled-coil protein SlyX